MAGILGTASAQELRDVLSPEVPASGTVLGLSLDPAKRLRLEEAIKRRDYTQAEMLLLEEIQRTPKSSQLLTLLGRIFFLDKKYLNAAIAMKKADAVGPLDDSNRFTLTMAYVVLNRRDWARPELEKLAQGNPRSALYHYWLARLDYDSMQYVAAMAKLRKVLEVDPNYMKAYDKLGLCYEALGQQDEAIQAYQAAIRLNRGLNRGSPWPPLNLGALLVKLGRIEEAEPYLKESLHNDPKLPQAHYELGILFEKQKRDAEAIQELSQATTLDPAYPEPHYALGRIYQHRGDAKNAELALSTFQRLKKQKRPD